MKRFVISEDERARILSMHESATKRQYLSEQPAPQQGGVTPQAAKAEIVKYPINIQSFNNLNAQVDKNTFPNEQSYDNYVQGLLTNIRSLKQIDDKFVTWCNSNMSVCAKNWFNSPYGKMDDDKQYYDKDGADFATVKSIEGHVKDFMFNAAAESLVNKKLDSTAARKAWQKFMSNTGNMAGIPNADKAYSMFVQGVKSSLTYESPEQFKEG